MTPNQAGPGIRYCQYCEARLDVDRRNHLPIYDNHESRCTIVYEGNRELVIRSRETAQFKCIFCLFYCRSIDKYQRHVNKDCKEADDKRAVCMQGAVSIDGGIASSSSQLGDQLPEYDYEADTEGLQGGLPPSVSDSNSSGDIGSSRVRFPPPNSLGAAAQGNALPYLASSGLPMPPLQPSPNRESKKPKVRLLLRTSHDGTVPVTIYPGSDHSDSTTESDPAPATPSDPPSSPRPSGGENANPVMMVVDSNNAF